MLKAIRELCLKALDADREMRMAESRPAHRLQQSTEDRSRQGEQRQDTHPATFPFRSVAADNVPRANATAFIS